MGNSTLFVYQEANCRPLKSRCSEISVLEQKYLPLITLVRKRLSFSRVQWAKYPLNKAEFQHLLSPFFIRKPLSSKGEILKLNVSVPMISKSCICIVAFSPLQVLIEMSKMLRYFTSNLFLSY